MFKEIVEIIIEIMEIIFSNLAWPLLALLFIIVFRKPIVYFIKHIEEVTIAGMKLKRATPTEQEFKGMKIELPKLEAEIKEIKKVKVKKNSAKLLSKEYKKLSDKYLYERNLNSIYGTQLALLEYLSRRRTSEEKYINLKDFYDDFSKRWLAKLPTSTPPLMIKYFEFLEDCGYIEYVGEGDERIVKITPRGKKFLSYIKDQYPAEYKPFRHL